MRIKLKNSRLKKGYSIDELANKLDISASHLYKIESGIRNPNISLARHISILLDEDMEELFFNQGLDETSNKRQSFN